MDWSGGCVESERILSLTGPFTISSVRDFQEIIRIHLPPILIVDLAQVSYMDSAGLAALIGVHVSCQRDSRKYAIVAPSERLHTVFRVAGMAGILAIFPGLPQAEAALHGHAALA